MHAWPFLTEEARRLAVALGAAELWAYTAYLSDWLPTALAEAWPADDDQPDTRSADVVAAAAQDSRSSAPAVLAVAHGGNAPVSRLVLRMTDSSALSAAVAAMVVEARLSGVVGPASARQTSH